MSERIGSATRVLALVGVGALSACVAAPGDAYPQPLVAYPGPNKTSADFAKDDVACRSEASAATPQVPAATSSGGAATNLAPASANAAGNPPATSDSNAASRPTPASVYYSCMTAHNNTIGAAPNAGPGYGQYAVVSPYVYGGYPYGYYPYYGGYYPGAFADEFFLDRNVGLYGGFGFGYGYGGYRGGYGYRGYHGGYGGYHGGFGGHGGGSRGAYAGRGGGGFHR